MLEPSDDFVSTVSDFLFKDDRLKEYVSDWNNLPKNANKRASRISNDDLFIINIRECPFYGIKQVKNLHPILMYIIARLGLENQKKQRYSDQKRLRCAGNKMVDLLLEEKEGEVTIEHMMPQTLNKDWHIDLGGKSKANVIHDAWVDRLANLMLLIKNDNSSISNKKFKDKKGTFKNSPLPFNVDVARRKGWTESQLSDRTKNLVKLASELWGCRNIH